MAIRRANNGGRCQPDGPPSSPSSPVRGYAASPIGTTIECHVCACHPLGGGRTTSWRPRRPCPGGCSPPRRLPGAREFTLSLVYSNRRSGCDAFETYTFARTTRAAHTLSRRAAFRWRQIAAGRGRCELASSSIDALERSLPSQPMRLDTLVDASCRTRREEARGKRGGGGSQRARPSQRAGRENGKCGRRERTPAEEPGERGRSRETAPAARAWGRTGRACRGGLG